MPSFITQRGACGLVPAMKSKAAPIATNVRPLMPAIRCTSRSCFGVPIPTQTIDAPDAVARSTDAEFVVGEISERWRLRSGDHDAGPTDVDRLLEGSEYLGRAPVQVVADPVV